MRRVPLLPVLVLLVGCASDGPARTGRVEAAGTTRPEPAASAAPAASAVRGGQGVDLARQRYDEMRAHLGRHPMADEELPVDSMSRVFRQWEQERLRRKTAFIDAFRQADRDALSGPHDRRLLEDGLEWFGAGALALGLPDQAQRAYEDAIRLVPDSVAARAARREGLLLAEVCRGDLDAAERLARQFVGVVPPEHKPSVLVLRGDLLAVQGDITGAMPWYDRAQNALNPELEKC